MKPIKLTVAGTDVTVTDAGPLTAGLVGQPVVFTFDSVWDGLQKTAVFRAGEKILDAEMSEDSTAVPPEVLKEPYVSLHIGVYGTNAVGTLAVPTVWTPVGVIQPGAHPSGEQGTDVAAVYQAGYDMGYAEGLAQLQDNPVPQAVPTVEVSDTGLIIARAVQEAGYVEAGTESKAVQLPVRAAQTITPGIKDQTISAGVYTTGTQTIKGDANLLSKNIVSGVSIFGVAGSAQTGSGTINIVNGSSQYGLLIGVSYIPCGQQGRVVNAVTEGYTFLNFVLMGATSVNAANSVQVIADNQTQLAADGVWSQVLTTTGGAALGVAVSVYFYTNADKVSSAEYLTIRC